MADPNFHINYFGSVIPYNSDNLPERKYFFGQGTSRPLGFTLAEMSELYWTVKSFNINIQATDLNFDAFTRFMLNGGASAGIIGATAGLASVQQELAKSPVSPLVGRSKIFNAYSRKIRKSADYVFKSVLPSSVEIDKEAKPNILFSIKLDVTEGDLCSAGNISTVTKSADGDNAYCQINFTDIIYANGLYWPIIVIYIGRGNAVLTSNLRDFGPDQNAITVGGINFANMGVITMSGFSLDILQPFGYLVDGNISIGGRCCDRFYYDGVDRSSDDDPCKNDCKEVVYTKLPSELNSKFIGGGGDSGGAGANGSW